MHVCAYRTTTYKRGIDIFTEGSGLTDIWCMSSGNLTVVQGILLELADLVLTDSDECLRDPELTYERSMAFEKG